MFLRECERAVVLRFSKTADIPQPVKHFGVHSGKPPAFSRNLFLLELIAKVYMIPESGPCAESNRTEADCNGQVRFSCTSSANKEATQ